MVFIMYFQKKIEKIHETVVKGDMEALQSQLTRKKLGMSKDDNGLGLLHKAVYHGHREIVDWLLEKHPETLEVKDWAAHCFHEAVLSLMNLVTESDLTTASCETRNLHSLRTRVLSHAARGVCSWRGGAMNHCCVFCAAVIAWFWKGAR